MSFFNTVSRNDTKLQRLRTVLTHFPHCIPLGNSKYQFEHFTPDPEKAEECSYQERRYTQESGRSTHSPSRPPRSNVFHLRVIYMLPSMRRRVKLSRKFLVSQLQVEYELKGEKIRGLDAGVALAKLNEQIIACQVVSRKPGLSTDC